MQNSSKAVILIKFGVQAVETAGQSDALNSGGQFVPLIARVAAQIANSDKFPRMNLHHAGETFSVEQTAMSFLKTGFNVLGLSKEGGRQKKTYPGNDTCIFFRFQYNLHFEI